MSKYSLRPIHKPGQQDIKDFYKIFVPPKLYISLRPSPKDLWILEVEGTTVAIGKLSQAQDEIQNKVLQVTHEFKDLFGLNFSDNYILRKSDTQVKQAAKLILVEEAREDASPLTSSDIGLWQIVLSINLKDRMVSPGLRIENVEIPGDTRSFKVKTVSNADSINDLSNAIDIHNISKSCRIQLDLQSTPHNSTSAFLLDRDGIFGNNKQLDMLDQTLCFHGPLPPSFTNFIRIIRTGVLLSGPAGTGKTLLAKRISELSWKTRTTITQADIGKSPAKNLSEIFENSLKYQPSLIIIPDFQDLLTSFGASLEKALTSAFNAITNARVLVVAEADSATISPRLMQCFESTIQMASLDEHARRDLILRELSALNLNLHSAQDIAAVISQKTPGYTGRDLQQLIKDSTFIAQVRFLRERHLNFFSSPNAYSNHEANEPEDLTFLNITLADVEQARISSFSSTRAKDHESRHKATRWSDIGGQEDTKKTVEMLFEWPLKYPGRFKALNLRPGKGLLLYGPPGCSKTMTALALATEAKLNFIAIKGPELLSKYVGESEQNLRNVFARARSMSPCVIFFDEIDSIGSGGSNTSDSQGGINLISTLLNELDGVDELRGVSVLAATNRPWDLDQALLRPGRFDKMVYVKLPDEKTRREILQLRLDAMQHEDININDLIEGTEGCSGAEIVDLCRNAALLALEEQIHLDETRVEAQHFTKALLQLRRDTSLELVARFDAFAKRA